MAASVAAGSCDGTVTAAELSGKTLEILVMDESGNPVGAAGPTATFTPDDLVSQQTNAPYETHQTTAAYYDAIDPLRAKTTLARWLDANCFDSTAANFGVTPTSLTSAHATYTNNYDLGLGRDMYFTICTAASPAVVNGLAKIGDMASVVINYVGLEAAASKLNPIIAVAMEYSAATDAATTGAARSQRRFPKFYAFAPDDRDGSFKRVMTVNFDHRGEKARARAPAPSATAPPRLRASPISFIPRRRTIPPFLIRKSARRPGAQLGLGDNRYDVHALGSRFVPVHASAPSSGEHRRDIVRPGLSVNPAGELFTVGDGAEASKYSTNWPTAPGSRKWKPARRVRLIDSRRRKPWYLGGMAGLRRRTAVIRPIPLARKGSAPTASLAAERRAYNDSGAPPDNWTNQAPAGSKYRQRCLPPQALTRATAAPAMYRMPSLDGSIRRLPRLCVQQLSNSCQPDRGLPPKASNSSTLQRASCRWRA